MEQHAVPQDITGFKFKLVGDMTLKQFGELAGGAILAYLFFASNWPFFLKWPLAAFFALFGLALAFLPVEERPLDVWVINLIKAIYQPTLYIWKKGLASRPAIVDPSNITTFVGPPAPAAAPQLWPYPKEPVAETPKPLEKPKVENPVVKPLSVEELQQLRDKKIVEIEEVAHPPKPAPPPPKEPEFFTIDALATLRDKKRIADKEKLTQLSSQNQDLMAQVKAVQTKILSLTGSDTTLLQNQLQELEKQRTALATQIADLREQLEGAGATRVQVVEKPATKLTSLQLTDVPNIISGLVLNEKGQPLDNTIIIVKDKTGNSIRALKTNQIGQFIASTPLENGDYYLEFERAGYAFNALEINLYGEIVQPLQIPAQSTNGHN